MKNKRFFTSAIAAAVILLMASIASAVPGANFVYTETNVAGSYRYDYTFFNTSTEGESLYEVFFYFTQDVSVTGTSIPAGWDGLPWTGANTTSYLNAYSTDFPYDIAAGGSLGGFSFTTNIQVGNLSYDANLTGDNIISGTTAVAPEPVSTILFLTGGATLAARRYFGKRKT